MPLTYIHSLTAPYQIKPIKLERYGETESTLGHVSWRVVWCGVLHFLVVSLVSVYTHES